MQLLLVTFVLALGYSHGLTVDTSDATVQQAVLDQHNSIRRQKPATGMFELSWDAETADRAQQWVNKCNYAHPQYGTADYDTYMKTSQYSLGQNIAKSSGVMSWTDIINLWYSEIKNFKMDQSTSATVGHYTQLVWNTTFLLGCAYADCGSFKFYACDYAPAGNMMPNQYSPYEAGTACAKCQGACDNGLCTNPCPYVNEYSNCEKADGGMDALFPDGCDNAPDYLADFKQYCQATCNCKGSKLY